MSIGVIDKLKPKNYDKTTDAERFKIIDSSDINWDSNFAPKDINLDTYSKSEVDSKFATAQGWDDTVLANAKKYTDTQIAASGHLTRVVLQLGESLPPGDKADEFAIYMVPILIDNDGEVVDAEEFTMNAVTVSSAIATDAVVNAVSASAKEVVSSGVNVHSLGSTRIVYEEYIWIKAEQAWEKLGDTDPKLDNYYTKSQVDDAISEVHDTALAEVAEEYLSLHGGVLLPQTTSIQPHGTISNIPTPTDDLDAANKKYVDNVSSMLQSDETPLLLPDQIQPYTQALNHQAGFLVKDRFIVINGLGSAAFEDTASLSVSWEDV